MTRITLVLVLGAALGLTACKKGGGAAGGADCAGAVDHMMKVQMGDMPKDMDEATKKQITAMMGKVQVAIVKSCQDTKWSADAISCIKAAKTDDDGKKCEEKLTKEQREAAEKAAESAGEMGAMPKEDMKPTEPTGSGSAAPAAGSADAAGSAAGSAAPAAGSADAAGSAAGSAAPAAGSAAAGSAEGSAK